MREAEHLGADESLADAEPLAARLDREDRLYDRVLALRGSLAATQQELDDLATKLRVAHLSLERAQDAAAWRFGHGVSNVMRRAIRRRGSGGSDAFGAAMARFAALEQRSHPGAGR